MNRTTSAKDWLHVRLPRTEYGEALKLQRELVRAKAEKEIDEDIVLSLEHPRVFTIGRRGGRENLIVTEDFLAREGVPVIEVERGGDITFHGPGQVVVYPIVDLERAGVMIGDFITHLEEAMIRTAAAYGVKSGRNSLNRGIWVGKKKMGSVGVCVRRGIAFHGLALNVNVSLGPFGWINPCGLQGIGMTSMQREVSQELPIEEVRDTLVQNMASVFEVYLVETDLSGLKGFAGAGERNPADTRQG